MKKKENIRKKIVGIFVCALLVATSIVLVAHQSSAHWEIGDGHKMHYPQLPCWWGVDVNCTFPIFLADDWLCTESGPVTDLHFWGSWRHDLVGIIDGFSISIWSNNATWPSNPEELLWHQYVTQYTTVDMAPDMQGWYDHPYEPGFDYFPGDHALWFQYNINITEDHFWQENGTIYWLALSANVSTPGTYWGWKNSTDHFMDDAYWGVDMDWYYELFEPESFYSLDLAFVITGAPCCNKDWDYWTNWPHIFSLPPGNVGIGTSTPAAKLHVTNGAVLFDGTVGGTPVSGVGTRLMWIPSKAAFRAGYVSGSQWDDANIGVYSTAMGLDTTASGWMSTALGDTTTANGSFGATALGGGTTASGDWSTAMGLQTTASGYYSTAMGSGTTASGAISTAMGSLTIASGDWGATAMGRDTVAWGETSTAMGRYTNASGNYATAMGYDTVASGGASTAMGQETTASGSWSTAMGRFTDAINGYATAMGYDTTASGIKSTAMGANTIASGEASTALGYYTTASGHYSTAMGRTITVSGENSVGIGLNSTSYTVSDDNVLSVMGGFVGMGTTSPQAPLDVRSGYDTLFRVIGTTTTADPSFWIESTNAPQAWRFAVQRNSGWFIFTDNTNSKYPFVLIPNTPSYSLRFYPTKGVINDNGNNWDFIVESTGNTNMFFIDASADRVGIGTNTPSKTLDVNGDISLEAGSGSYYSSDGSQGWTGTFTNGDGNTVTVKDGIITDVSPP